GRIAAQVAGNLQRLTAAHRQVDDDGIRVEALGHDAGLEAAVGDLVLEVVVFRRQLFQAVDEQLIRPDNEDFVETFFFKFAQGHSMLFEELDELISWYAPVLAAGDAVAAEPARIEPLTHCTWCDLADLRHLPGGKDFFHGRHSSFWDDFTFTRSNPAGH